MLQKSPSVRYSSNAEEGLVWLQIKEGFSEKETPKQGCPETHSSFLWITKGKETKHVMETSTSIQASV